MIYRAILVILVWAFPAFAVDVTLSGKLEQGGLVLGTAPAGSKIAYEGRSVPVSETGTFLLGLHRDAPARADLTIELPGGLKEAQNLSIAPRDWHIERVDGVPQTLVTPDPETAAKIAADSRKMAAARAQVSLTPFYETGFLRPAEGRISGVFGSQRILNGSPRAPHSGLDIAAPQGTPIRATADGIVSLSDPDMTLTGQTVFINHGFGLQSVYIHMSAIHVENGQSVKQGDVIGEIGMTGRATGPHLHFGVTWFDTRLDPETVLTVLPVN